MKKSEEITAFISADKEILSEGRAINSQIVLAIPTAVFPFSEQVHIISNRFPFIFKENVDIWLYSEKLNYTDSWSQITMPLAYRITKLYKRYL